MRKMTTTRKETMGHLLKKKLLRFCSRLGLRSQTHRK